MKVGMKHASSLLAALALVVFAAPGHAACYADYKAKQDNPLQLHYGVVQVSGECSKDAAASQIARRIGAEGWKLLTVLTVFDENGLEKRKKSAGQYFLRY